jgi:hypothetical protein
MVGIFGWTGTPAAFQVVTRAITWELRHALRSSTFVYVDEIMGVCFAKDFEVNFAFATPILVAEFDSSLSGAGLIWSVRTDGAEVVRGVSAVNLAFLGFGTDSSNQNLAEYIGAILAVIGQVILFF